MSIANLPLLPEISAGFASATGSLPELKSFLKAPLVQMEQVHGSSIAVVSEPAKRYPHVDAIITTKPNLALVVRTSDCLPILIAHPSGLIAAVHAGRKGTDDGILYKTLKKLKRQFGLHDQVHLWLGPHICANCYQIDRKTDLHYNLRKENLKQVISIYLDSQVKVAVSEDCTLEAPDLHSYRETGPGVEMNYAGIVLKSASK